MILKQPDNLYINQKKLECLLLLLITIFIYNIFYKCKKYLCIDASMYMYMCMYVLQLWLL